MMNHKHFCILFVLSFLTLSLGAQERDFRVMSFNIERGDLGVKRHRGWIDRKEACLEMLRVRRPDLLGVQECNAEQREDILGQMKGYRCTGIPVSGKMDDTLCSGNYIFYDTAQFELLDKGSFWFAFHPERPGEFTWFAAKPRNANWGIFLHKKTGRKFLYINNHLQNGVDAVLNRTMSLHQLLGEMRRLNQDGLPMLYSGDLNSLGIEGYYAPLNQEMREAALHSRVTDRRTTFGGYKKKGEGKRIDHIFFSGALEGLAYAVDQEAYAGVEHISDHFPIYTDFRFTEEKDALTQKDFWYDLKPGDKVLRVTAGTWELELSEEKDHWKSRRVQVADALMKLDADIIGVQGLSAQMVSDLPKQIKKAGGSPFKVWSAFSSQDASEPSRKAIGLVYNAKRFRLNQQHISWITGGDTDLPGPAWDNGPHAILSAVCTDQESGRRFFVMTGRLPEGKTAVKREGFIIKGIEAKLNRDKLPCLLMVDMNCPPRSQVFLSLLNYWADCYTIQEDRPDMDFNTLACSPAPEVNSKEAWRGKRDLICISRYVENRIIVASHQVVRDLVPETGVRIADHYPLKTTLCFK